jgi:hypothetical protein
MALPEVKVRITADDRGLEKGLGSAQAKLASFAKVGAAAAAAAVVAVGAAFANATRNAINFADEMAKTSQRIGVTTEALSKLQYAAKLSDVSLSDLRVGLSQLARNMDMNSDAFERLGIAIRNQDGSLRDTGDVFNDLVERFSRMQDGAQKTALAMEIFGRSGANMIPLLNAGAAGLKSMTDEAEQLGLVIDRNTSKRAEQFNDNITRLSSVLDGIGVVIASKALPGLVKLTNSIVTWAKETNIAERIGSALNWVFETSAVLLARLSAQWDQLTNAVTGASEAIGLALSGNFGAASDRLNQMLAKNTEIWEAYKKRVDEIMSAAPAEVTVGGGRVGGEPAAQEEDPELVKMRERLTSRLDMLRESLMTERELLQNEYAEQQTLLVDALNQKLLSETEYAQRRKQLEERLQDDLAKLDEIRRQQALGASATLFGGLAQLAQLGGKKLFNIAKAFSIAEAVMNTAQAVTKTYTTLPYPFNIPAAIGQAAAGAAQIATIASTQPGGGGGAIKAPSASGGAGAAAAPAAAAPAAGGGRPTQVALQLTGGDLFGRDQVISLINAINEAQEDGAVVRLV